MNDEDLDNCQCLDPYLDDRLTIEEKGLITLICFSKSEDEIKEYLKNPLCVNLYKYGYLKNNVYK